MVPPQTNHFLLISLFFIVFCDLFLVPAASLGGGFCLVRKTDSRLRWWMEVSEGRGQRRQGVGTSLIVSTIEIKFKKNSGCGQSCWAGLQQAAWEPQHALEQGLQGEVRSYSIGAPKITRPAITQLHSRLSPGVPVLSDFSPSLEQLWRFDLL